MARRSGHLDGSWKTHLQIVPGVIQVLGKGVGITENGTRYDNVVNAVLVAESFDHGVMLGDIGFNAFRCSSFGVLIDFLGVGIANLSCLVTQSS